MNAPEHESRTYEDFSKEFKEKVARAYDLIPLMYNRLTLVEQYSYKEAKEKIINDHVHIQGFSSRNISRYLPLDNPTIPRRVRTKRHNSIPTHNTLAEKLSNTEPQHETNKHQSQNNEFVIESKGYNESSKQKAGLSEAILRQTASVTTNKIPSTGLTFKIFKENYEIVRIAMNSSNEYVRLVFDIRGTFESAESDIIKSRI